MRFKINIASAGCNGRNIRKCIKKLKEDNINVEYKDDYENGVYPYYESSIEINSIEELIAVRDSLDIDLIIEKNLNPNESGYILFIYNDYIE